MKISIPFDTIRINLAVPESAIVYQTDYPDHRTAAAQTVLDAIRHPVAALSLKTVLAKRRPGKVVVVVSDITRPIPYKTFLPELLAEIESAGVKKEEIQFLIATGMHRPSTEAERRAIFGNIVGEYDIQDHNAQGTLMEIPGRSLSGRRIFLNKHFVEAGFRIITGLVEPHFMAGFSGGRKSVCPGLVSLETIQAFHSYGFLSSPKAASGSLDGNPCHAEALSVAKLAGVDFSVNIVLDTQKRVVKAFAGDLEAAHQAACVFVRKYACPAVRKESDVVLIGCGGYPLDATFYQCVKGIVAAVPAVKTGGMIIAVGGCREGMGSENYRTLMCAYADDYRGFLDHIKHCQRVEKDQWQFQMQTRALEKVGSDGLVMFSAGLDEKERNPVAGRFMPVSPDSAAKEIQKFIDKLISEGKNLAVIPEGPYCTPVCPPLP